MKIVGFGVALAVASPAIAAPQIMVNFDKTQSTTKDALGCRDMEEFKGLIELGSDAVARRKAVVALVSGQKCRIVDGGSTVYVVGASWRGYYRLRPAGETEAWWVQSSAFE